MRVDTMVIDGVYCIPSRGGTVVTGEVEDPLEWNVNQNVAILNENGIHVLSGTICGVERCYLSMDPLQCSNRIGLVLKGISLEDLRVGMRVYRD